MAEYLTKESENWEEFFSMKRTEDFSMDNLLVSYADHVILSDFTQHYMEISQQDLFAIVIMCALKDEKSVIVDSELVYDASLRGLSFTVFWSNFIIDLYKNSVTGKCYISFI